MLYESLHSTDEFNTHMNGSSKVSLPSASFETFPSDKHRIELALATEKIFVRIIHLVNLVLRKLDKNNDDLLFPHSL